MDTNVNIDQYEDINLTLNSQSLSNCEHNNVQIQSITMNIKTKRNKNKTRKKDLNPISK